MDNNKKIPADMEAFMRELISEYIDMDVEMFAKRGDIFSAMYKADEKGQLDSFYKKLQDKLSGKAAEAADYFYSFLLNNREDLGEESKGLWHNIRAKQARGEKPAPKGSKAYKDAVKAAEKINATNERIEKVDGKYVVYPSKGGKRLGTHDTKEKALAQLRAIEASKYSKEEITQAVKEVLMEGATCCGRCGRVHKLKKDGGLGCKKPYLSKSSPEHCMNK